MRRALHVAAALALVLALSAGCLGGPSVSTTPESPTRSSTDTAGSPSPTRPGDAGTVQYVVRAGQVPDHVVSVELTVQAVFAERGANPRYCTPEVLTGPFKPTPTPLPTPGGECWRTEPVTVNLTAGDGRTVLGPYEVPEGTGGHVLLVTDVTARLANGSVETSIYGIGGTRALVEEAPPAAREGVRIGIAPAGAARYEYYLATEPFDPRNTTAETADG